ncbi:MAG TPA: TIGR01777 family oxidoreductase [Sediminibacterium sp.]|nr:TIGR01777 family oxidoreductase [Sediminibacterium sp.]
MPVVLITGGTGTVGKRLAEMLLQKGYEVAVLSRKDGDAAAGVRHFRWNPGQNDIDPAAIASADFIVHLAGAGVADRRWTQQRKQEIADSRSQSSALIVSALRRFRNKVQCVVSASAIGWYGPDPAGTSFAGAAQKGFDESAPASPDFLGETCRQWESGISPVTEQGIRLVILRTGIVLSNGAGAFAELKKPLRFRMAAILGNGRQMISWIHLDDLCNQYIFALEHPQLRGVYNAVAPHPVTNQTLTLKLAKKCCGSLYIPFHVPAFVLKTVLGEMSIEVLKSTTVCADKISAAGFPFQFPSIDLAIDQLIP